MWGFQILHVFQIQEAGEQVKLHVFQIKSIRPRLVRQRNRARCVDIFGKLGKRVFGATENTSVLAYAVVVVWCVCVCVFVVVSMPVGFKGNLLRLDILYVFFFFFFPGGGGVFISNMFPVGFNLSWLEIYVCVCVCLLFLSRGLKQMDDYL